jgi:SAM-dependent methyltransferase
MITHGDKLLFLTAGLDIASADGLEIGPRDAPLISKRACNVLYADYADARTIRTNVREEKIDPERVVEIDIVTTGGKLSDVTERRFDYIVASHVAEHVPDFLGWLNDLHTVLRPGGTIGLAVPDRRFTFDRMRAESTIAEVLEAWLMAYERPSIRQIIDSAWQSIDISPAQGWSGEVPPQSELLKRHARLAGLLEWSRATHKSGEYVDAHCWVFTPSSFLNILQQLNVLNLFPFVVERCHPTDVGGYEFLVLLRKAEGALASDISSSIERAILALGAHRGQVAFAAGHGDKKLFAARAEAAALADELAAMRTSLSWRLTAPARRLRNMFIRLRAGL